MAKTAQQTLLENAGIDIQAMINQAVAQAVGAVQVATQRQARSISVQVNTGEAVQKYGLVTILKAGANGRQFPKVGFVSVDDIRFVRDELSAALDALSS